MLGEHAFAQPVERFGFGADVGFERFADICGEGEGIEARSLVVSRAGLKRSARCKNPADMNGTTQDSKGVCIWQSESY